MKGGEILREILRTDLIQAERSEQDANREHLLRAQDSVDCDTVWLDTLQATRILTLAFALIHPCAFGQAGCRQDEKGWESSTDLGML